MLTPTSHSNKMKRAPDYSGGRPPFYSNPNDLLESVFAYLDWVKRNPLSDYKLTSKGDLIEVPKKRYPTTSACARFCGVSPRTWRSWKSKNHLLSEVVEFAEDVILQIKMEGVAVGLFSPSIVAREIANLGEAKCEPSFTVNVTNNLIE